MNSKHIDALKKYIEKYGIIETANLTGISIVEVILKTKVKFNDLVAKKILEYLSSKKKLPNKYKEFEINFNSFYGLVEWFGIITTDYYGKTMNEQIAVLATPFFENDSEYAITVVETINYDVYYDGKLVIEEDDIEYQDEFFCEDEYESIEELLLWYKNEYLINVYNIIVNKHLPSIRKKHK